MNIDINFLNTKLNEYCLQQGISLQPEETQRILNDVIGQYNLSKIMDSSDFMDIIDYNHNIGQYDIIDFDDEIISIEECGEMESIDFNISGNKLFYANGILTHNSAVNNKDADNSAVSDSIGTVQTSDFILFLLQDDKMKEQNLITCKCTKNRFTGRTDQWNMNIDYIHMRFMDAVVQGNGLTEDEAKRIIQEQQYQDYQKIKAHDKKINIQDTQIKDDLDLNALLGL